MATREARVRQMLAAWGRRDLDAFLEGAGPGFELDLSRRSINGRVARTREDIDELRADFEDNWEWYEMVLEDFYELPDGALAMVLVRASGRASGVPVEARVAYRYVFDGDRVTRLEYFPERQEALREVGLA